jgi:hypothetical protein
MRPPISVGDLLRAFHAIKPRTENQKRDVASLLGLQWRVRSAAPRAPKVKKPAAKARTPRVPPTRPPPTTPPPAAPSGAPTIGYRLSGPQTVPRPQLDWLRSGPALDDRPTGEARKPAPLFRPQWTRAILGASLSSRGSSGEPDLERAVELIARGETLRILPRRPAMTLACGVQALLDIGESMQPFVHDRGMLRRDLRRIVGEGNLDILSFVESPRRVRRDGAGGAWTEYWPGFLPQTGACVLVVSDFGATLSSGLAQGPSLSLWRRLAIAWRRRGHRVVAFVPFSPERWPQSLARAISFVQWDRTTTVSRIRFSQGGGLAS